MASRAVFWNPDGLTQFGTPFEIRTENNYSIRTKGGNVGGYTASFSYVPELQLGECSTVMTKRNINHST